jgi:hypothetical protein
MDPAKWDTGIVHTLQQGLPRRFSRKAGIHQGEPAAILERIRIDVSKAREIDRELQTEDSSYDLDDLWRGVLLFLFFDAGAYGSIVLVV